MAVEPVQSRRFPYLPIELRVGEHAQFLEALVDSGFEGDVAVPEGTAFPEPAVARPSWAFANGLVVEAAVYLGTVRLGGYETLPALIAALGEEVIIGRGVIDRYLVTFDHGERVTAEP